MQLMHTFPSHGLVRQKRAEVGYIRNYKVYGFLILKKYGPRMMTSLGVRGMKERTGRWRHAGNQLGGKDIFPFFFFVSFSLLHLPLHTTRLSCHHLHFLFFTPTPKKETDILIFFLPILFLHFIPFISFLSSRFSLLYILLDIGM